MFLVSQIWTTSQTSVFQKKIESKAYEILVADSSSKFIQAGPLTFYEDSAVSYTHLTLPTNREV